MRQDQFRSRYFIKLSSSILIAVLNAIIQLILPRVFSVEQYGYYTYNLNVFTSVVLIANLSTSSALISKYSKRNEEIGLLFFYVKFYVLEVIILSLAICVLCSLSSMRRLFAGQTVIIVLLGVEVALVSKFQNDIIGIYDAMAVSRVPAIFQIALKIVMSAFVIGCYLLGTLNLQIFYVGQLILTGTVVTVLLYLIIRFQRKKFPKIIDHGFIAYLREYYIFCRPLVVAVIVAQLIAIIMNWALMRWAGAVEQAMFGAAWQLNTLISYVFSPYAELSKREYAIACQDKECIKRLYEKSVKLMLWLISYFALFVGFCANWILPVVYGDKYSGAAIITLLIMVYTVYQAVGQINGALMLATEKTKMHALLSVIGQIITAVLIFFFQIPNVFWPNGLGAIGIALVYVVGNIITTYIGVIYISHSFDFPVWNLFKTQILAILLCSGLAYGLNFIFDLIWKSNGTFIYICKIICAGTIYTLTIVTLIWNKPEYIGITKESKKNILEAMKRKLHI